MGKYYLFCMAGLETSLWTLNIWIILIRLKDQDGTGKFVLGLFEKKTKEKVCPSVRKHFYLKGLDFSNLWVRHFRQWKQFLKYGVDGSYPK